VYPTRDGDWVIIGANQDSVFGRLAELAKHPEWSASGGPYDTHIARGARQGELDDKLAEWTRTMESAELLKLLSEAGVPSGRIYTSRDISTDDHFAARDMIVEVAEPTLDGETVRGPGVVPKLTGTPGTVRRGSPVLGEHTNEVLGGVIGDERLAELRTAGVV
jgi:crotonobetainyl-CoA:carnitine CoA-transferase CaiB-like acyl-CoA transferase